MQSNLTIPRRLFVLFWCLFMAVIGYVNIQVYLWVRGSAARLATESDKNVANVNVQTEKIVAEIKRVQEALGIPEPKPERQNTSSSSHFYPRN